MSDHSVLICAHIVVRHLVMPGTDRLKNAIINVVRAARRTRERRGQTRKSLGAGM
jgi:hypothetical protein